MKSLAEIADAGIVYQNVHLPERPGGLRDHVLDMGFIRDGADDGQRSSAVHPDTFHDTVEFLFPATGDDDVRPFIRKQFGNGLADSCIATGNDGHFPL